MKAGQDLELRQAAWSPLPGLLGTLVNSTGALSDGSLIRTIDTGCAAMALFWRAGQDMTTTVLTATQSSAQHHASADQPRHQTLPLLPDAAYAVSPSHCTVPEAPPAHRTGGQVT